MNNTRKSLILFGLGTAVGYIANLSVEKKDQIKATVKGFCDRVTESFDSCTTKFKEEDTVENSEDCADLDYDFSLIPMTFTDQTSAYLTVANVVKYIRAEKYVTFAEVMLERSINESTEMPGFIPDIWREFGWTDADAFIPYKTTDGLWKITDVLPHRLSKVEKDDTEKGDTTE